MRQLICALMVVAMSTSVFAQGQAGRKYDGRRHKGAYALIALKNALPGGYALIDRLELTDGQKKLLEEIAAEHGKQRSAMQRQLHAKRPKLSKEDWKDAEKRAEYHVKWKALRAELKVKPPVEKVANVLTPEQLGQILEVNALHEKWVKWVSGHMKESGAELDKLLGAEPEKADAKLSSLMTILRQLIEGGALLGRVGLTDEQVVALTKVRDEYNNGRSGLYDTMYGAVRSDKLTVKQAASVRGALMRNVYAELKKKFSGKVEAVLTAEQKDKLAKALELTQTRNTALTQKYLVHVGAVNTLLPPKKKAAGGRYPYYGAPEKARVRKVEAQK
jgi:Spy/CpxP family protein refolding chaperone